MCECKLPFVQISVCYAVCNPVCYESVVEFDYSVFELVRTEYPGGGLAH